MQETLNDIKELAENLLTQNNAIIEKLGELVKELKEAKKQK
jgi:hypothetical protein